MSRTLLIFSLIALTVLVGAVPAQPTQAQSGPAIDYENLVVVEVKELNIRFWNAYLSPDGQRIAILDGPNFLAIYDADGTLLSSIDLGAIPLQADSNSIRWSPDSTRIMLTEDFFRYFREPDIWVIEASTGKITNLTDDQETRFRPGQTVSTLDLVPAWTPDSQRIFFIRYDSVWRAPVQTVIYSIAATGGEAKQEGRLDTPFLSVVSLMVSPDGEQIAFSVVAPSQNSPVNGMWVATPDGLNGRQLLQGFGRYDARFSADGRFVMAHDEFTLISEQNWGTSTSLVASVEKRLEVRLDDARGAHWGAWSPTGAAVAYIVRAPQQPEIAGLYVAAEPGQPGRLVYQAESLSPASVDSRLMPTWASNNTLLLMNRERRLLLLRFGTEA